MKKKHFLFRSRLDIQHFSIYSSHNQKESTVDSKHQNNKEKGS